MKLSLLLLTLLGVLATPISLLAAKADGPKAKAVAKYDANKDGKLTGDEVVAIRKDFAEAPEGDLKRFDADTNGKLEDAEIAKMVPGSGSPKEAGAAKKAGAGKKKAEAP